MIVNHDGENLASSSSDYDKPLVWIDLEMTGLDITKDRILEIACIITDGKLTKRIEVSIETKCFCNSDCSILIVFFAQKYLTCSAPLTFEFRK
jgi:DNA polymerase III epsilon subunit-like protein